MNFQSNNVDEAPEAAAVRERRADIIKMATKV